jgi:bifunctional non-homologous end joining protein LigD
MSLETYRQKRNFDRTSEPRGKQTRRKGHSFVVQKHDASRLHYDFRLELGGVLLSWAVPKGPSLDPHVKRLAMQTEDHPLDYGDFEGVIPAGEYGGGSVLLWDQGTWEPEGDAEEMYRRGRLNFELHGEKLHGRFHLVRTPSGEKRNERRWLLFKSNDEAAEPGTDARVLEENPRSVLSGRDLESIASDPDHVWTSRPADNQTSKSKKPARVSPSAPTPSVALAKQPAAKRAALPDFIEPQLATLAPEAPAEADWLHEIKLDGYRILARIEDGHARLLSRRGNDWTSRLPSLASALGGLPVSSAWLDGEVVVLRENGVSDFQQLQNSMEAGRDVGCVYFAFDAPFLDGFDIRRVPLRERKLRLREVFARLKNERVRFGDHIEGGGPAFFERACTLGLEGIVSKRADSPYTSGRGRAWLKVKCLSRQEFIVGGYTEPSGSRRHLGALLVGLRENGALSYAGKVGTGFTQASLAELAKRLAPLETKVAPFANPPSGAERRGVHWVEPQLVAEIAFVERTQDGMIRHASFQGLRDDKASEDVRLETAQASAVPAPPKPAKSHARAQSSTTRTKAQRAAAGAKAKSSTQPSKSPPSKSAPSSEGAGPTKKAARRAAPASVTARAKSSRASTVQAKKAEPIQLDIERFEITNPGRVLFPEQGITKQELMLHYARVARWMLPHVTERPLMLVRCPEGAGKQCFHQKHPSRGMPKAVEQVMVPQKKGPEANLMIRDAEGLFGLVQMGALEIHTWGCRADRLDCPDQLVFDLDPDEGLPWARVIEAAHTLHERLDDLGLAGFLRVTGGKGLHVVVPVEPTVPWDAAKQFTKSVADAMVQAEPSKYLATMTKQKRKGKIFLDYFRNGVGATAVCSYSTRARSGAPLAVPISWDELDERLSPDQFNVRNIAERLSALHEDPWESFNQARAPIPR